MLQSHKVHVLVVTDNPDPRPSLMAVIRRRAAQAEAVQFRVVVPNPAGAELHLSHPERHLRTAEVGQVLHRTLPEMRQVTGTTVVGAVSRRHDLLDAVEDALLSGPVDEIILSVSDHGDLHWRHRDLQHRLKHFGLPLTVVPPVAPGAADAQPS